MPKSTLSYKSSQSPNPTAPKSRTLEEIIRLGFDRCVDKPDDPNGCWTWNRQLTNWGYGRAQILAMSMSAHRLSWTIQYGSIPEGLLVLHKCDNRACVRPDHLFLGTNKDNSDDMIRKGRANGNGVLTKDVVIAIRALYKAGGISTPQLAREHGVGITTVADVIHRRTWAWVEEAA